MHKDEPAMVVLWVLDNRYKEILYRLLKRSLSAVSILEAFAIFKNKIADYLRKRVISISNRSKAGAKYF